MEADRMGAQDLIALVLDDQSWQTWDDPVDYACWPSSYRDELAEARKATGLQTSVWTGEGRIGGRRVALIVSEFEFLAGTVGAAEAQRVEAATQRATAERLPLVAMPASGGTRMQEGTSAFVRMVGIAAAVAAHKAAGLPYLVYLRHPTTGGVMASWGSLGHVTFAEPGALLGFLGPRVFKALYDTAFPAGVQTSENLYEKGLVDAVVSPDLLRDVLRRTLSLIVESCLPGRPVADPEDAPQWRGDPWESVARTRRVDRPGVRLLLEREADDFVALSGTGQGEVDRGLLLGLARFAGTSCVVLGQDRAGQSAERPFGPGGLRVARRGMRLAVDLGLPVLSVIDTRGAALSVDAEQGGLAGEIARCLSDLVTLKTPTLAVLLGEGTGGAALALLPADRIVAAQHAWLSPLPPEGASAIVHRDLRHAADMCRAQGISAACLSDAGVVDRIVPERPDAADEPEAFLERLGDVIRYELAVLVREPTANQEVRVRRRGARLQMPEELDTPA